MSNLVKNWNMNIASDEAYVIDSNEIAAKRIEEAAAKRGRKQGDASESFTPGFVSGLGAEDLDVDALLADGEMAIDENGNIIHAQEVPADYASEPGADPEEMLASVRAEAEQIIASANEQAQQILDQAMSDADSIRASAAEEGQAKGYDEGRLQADAEYSGRLRELDSQKAELETYYQQKFDEMESTLVDTITDIYEQIFRSDLSKEREILIHLIGNTLQKVESGTTYLVHVSKDSYEAVAAQKEMLQSMVASSSCNVEIIEDISLSGDDCIIETDGGIFDCGLGTELKELSQRLRLLSYSKGQ